MNDAIHEQSAVRRAVHAYMLVAPDSTMALQEAERMARELMCLDPVRGGACGACQSCVLLNAGNHPDYIFISPKKSGGSIGVEDVRQIIPKLYIMPYISPLRVVVFSAADAMTTQAQNALLKALEEPPDGNVFLLPVARERAILDTVRSRCRRVWVKAETGGVNAPEGSDPTRYKAALRLSGGIAEKARALAENEPFFSARANLYARFLSFCQNPGAHAAYLAGALKAQADKKAAIELLMSLVRDSALCEIGLDIKGIMNTDYRDAVKSLASSQSGEVLVRIFGELSHAAEHLNMNASAQLAVDGLLSNMLEVFAR